MTLGGCSITIERLHRSFLIVLGRRDPIFWAVISCCNAGLFREALHEVYIPRIQRGLFTLRLRLLELQDHCSLL